MVGEIIRKCLYLEEDCPIMSGNEVKPTQGKPRRNQGMECGKRLTRWDLFYGNFQNFQIATTAVRPEKFQFLEKGQNRNFGYEIVILVKNQEFIL